MPTKNYKVTVSYESDLAPIETRRGQLIATNARSACIKAGSFAKRNWPKGRKFRSWVICVEQIGATDETAEG